MKLQSLPTFLVRRKNWLLMAALALSLTAALLLRPSSPHASNGGRALKVLASAGLITLKAEAGANPTVADIDTYNVKIEIKEMGAADIPSVLPDVTAAVVNGNYALDYGIDPNTAIFEEKDYDDDSYFCLMAVRSSDADDAVYKRIVELFQSETTKQIFQDEFNGYFVPAWEVQK